MKHTPGPWKVRDNTRIGPDGSVSLNFELIAFGAGGPNGQPIAYLDLFEYQKDEEEQHENALADVRLICAAPDLLMALHNVRNVLALALNNGKFDVDDSTDESESPDEVMTVLAGAAEAIAKAEGVRA